MLQDRLLFSLTYIGDMIQQMHELQVELGADVSVNYYLVSRASKYGIYLSKYIGSLLSYNLCKNFINFRSIKSLTLSKFNSFKSGSECVI